MKKHPLKWALLIGVTAAALYLCGLVLWPFLDVIAWSIVLVITFYPAHQHLLAKTRKPALSALLSSLLVVLTILVPMLLATALIVNEVADLRNFLQARFKDGFDLREIGPVRQILEWLEQRAGVSMGSVADTVSQHASELTQITAKYSLTFARNITNVIVSFAFTIFTVFFLFRDGERLVAAIPGLLPLGTAQGEALIRRTRDVIYGSIYGVLVIAVIQGSLGALAFAILRVPSPVLWGLVMSVTSLIPMLGAASVWVPVSIYLLVSGNWGRAIAMAAFGGLVISSVDNFIRPKLVGQRVQLSVLVMFFSVLGGLRVFGLVGIVLGPVLFAITGSLLEALRNAEGSAVVNEPE
jgi:predicted PurR-regulated permease PerM